MDSVYKNFYTDETGAYTTAAALHKAALGFGSTLEKAKEFIKSRESGQRFAQAPTGHWRHDNPPGFQYEIDLMETGKERGRFLVAVDKTSRFVFIEPINSKTIKANIEAMKKIIKANKKPLTLYSDRESAWTSAEWVAFVKSQDISHIYTNTHAALVERTIGILKQKYAKMAAARKEAGLPLPGDIRGTYRKIVEGLNASPMARVGGATRAELLKAPHTPPPPERQKVNRLEIGDNVRIRIKARKHSVAGRWGAEVYNIEKIIITPAGMQYKINGKLYTRKDLQKIGQVIKTVKEKTPTVRQPATPTTRPKSVREKKAVQKLDL